MFIGSKFRQQLAKLEVRVLDCDSNWNLLLYKEAYYINRLTPSFNKGLKSSTERSLFSSVLLFVSTLHYCY